MPNEYKTTDYGLATWLVFNRVTLVGTVAYPGDDKLKFVFLVSEPITNLVEEWERPRSADARAFKRFFVAHTIVKNALKESYDISRSVPTNK
jgi:hypothetical protein